MRILIFHNLLWAQYKSVIFEKIHATLDPKKDTLFVLQTAITENSRKDLVDFNLENFPYQYPFKLLNTKAFDHVSKWKTALDWTKEIMKFKPDVINLTGYFEPATLPILILAKIMGIKIVMTIESTDYRPKNENLWAQRIKSVYKSIIFACTSGYFSYGIKSNEYILKQGIPKSKILSFLNAIDQSKFSSKLKNEKELIIPSKQFKKVELIYVGRLSPEKNIFGLLNFMKVCKDQPFHLTIVGDGPLKSQIEAEIKLHSLKNISLAGSVQWNELAAIYQKSSCLLLPSFFEPWGMVANEAQALGKPIICTTHCGCAHDMVISGYSGLVLSDFESKANIALAQKYLLALQENPQQTAEFSFRNSSIFNADRIAFEMIRGYKKLVGIH